MSVKHLLSMWACCAALFLGACSKRDAQPAPNLDAALTGIVAYAEPLVLSHRAVVELTLTDVSADDGAVKIAETLIQRPAHLPLDFSLAYDSTLIQADHRYTVSARVLEDGQPQYVTDTAYAVITQGNPQRAEIRLVRSGAFNDAAPADTQASAETRVDGELQTPEGLSRYAAYFTDARLSRIEESRESAVQARYAYLGARLLNYFAEDKAAKLRLELQFDERGKLLKAAKQMDGAPLEPSAAEIDAARNRAALLRSHALATREIKAHRGL